MTSLYNRTALEPFTRANADDVNNETAKIKAAIDALTSMVQAVQDSGGGTGDGIARYTWLAYADSADGTVNFSHDPGNRAYVGLAHNKLTETASDFPEDYHWSLIRGSDAPTLRLVANHQRFDFDTSGNPTKASEILFTAEGTNLTTAISFAAANDSGNSVALSTVNATQVKLEVDDFGEADWVRVVASAEGGVVSDSITITAKRNTKEVNYRHRWQDDVSYGTNDIVHHKGSSHISLTDENLNNEPDQEDDTPYWGMLARQGAVGDPATPDSAFSTTINLTNDSHGINLARLARVAGYRGKANATITFNVPAGVVITGRNAGGIAIDSGDWPSDLYTIALTLTVESGGVVRGGGGDGGRGRGFGQVGEEGGDGGDAIYCREDMTVNVDAGGTVQAGGGGGNAGSSTTSGWPTSSYSPVGGGGGGFPNGNGGFGIGGDDGLDGTVAGGGLGGTPNGSDGGDAGADAIEGGVAGYAIRKNGQTVTVTNAGTVQGTIG